MDFYGVNVGRFVFSKKQIYIDNNFVILDEAIMLIFPPKPIPPAICSAPVLVEYELVTFVLVKMLLIVPPWN